MSKVIKMKAEVKATAEKLQEQIDKLSDEDEGRSNDTNMAALAKENADLKAKLNPIREWYGGGTEGNRPDIEILTDAIADLQDNRKELLDLKANVTKHALNYRRQHIEELEAENKRLKEEDRWIPVGERLPEEDADCLVIVGKFAGLGIYQLNSNTLQMQWQVGGCVSKQVTHWKPIILPKP